MMEEKVFSFMQQNNMLENGDKVIVALSGGADSMALFRFFLHHRQKLGIALSAVHIHHGLRGDEADRDANFVAEICQEMKVPLFLHHAKMGERTPQKGESVESWARQLRYEYFTELATQQQGKIATAHTETDNAETVLFRAIRGTGPKGLGGIPPVRGPFIRPLLGVTRQEVEEYCKANGVGYVTDSTNLQPCFARNKLRLEGMPVLEQVHPGAQKALGRLASDMRELNQWLDGLAGELLQKARVEQQGGLPCWRREVLAGAGWPVLKQALATLAGEGCNSSTLEQMRNVVQGEMQGANLPRLRRFICENGLVILQPLHEKPKVLGYSIPLQQGEICLPGGFCIEISVQEYAFAGEKPQNYDKTGKKGLTFRADYGRITKCSVFRTRKTGDWFYPPYRGVGKTLKKWMNEQKIPRELRGCLPVLADKEEILWVWGCGFSQKLSPNKETKQVLVIRQIREEGCQNHDI